MLRSSALTQLALVALASSAAAQLRQPGVPASTFGELPDEIPLVVLDAPAQSTLPPRNAPGPFRYGTVALTSLGMHDSGRWDQTDEGDLVWRIGLVSPGAFSLGVLFTEFDLPEGSRVHLYTPDRSTILGAYTAANEQPGGMLAIQPLPGDRAIIEYVQPRHVTGRPRLRVGEVVHDYENLLAHLARGVAPGGPGGSIASAGCQIDVNCPAGANHQDVKRAVVMLTAGGGLCSGSMLNNTGEDATPYVLTANHCGNFTNGVFYFEYERAGCSSGVAPQNKTLSGSTRLARSTTFDSQLYVLNGSPPASYHPFFAGWNKGLASGPTAGISHPAGNPKKIQIDHQNPSRSLTQWTVVNDQGLILGGSSGSPLFDSEKRVLGALSTASSSCGSDFANYGRFDRFYNEKDLGQYLDPRNWNPKTLDGYDPFQAFAIAYNGTDLNPVVYSSSTPPVLGATWMAEIDTSMHGGTVTSIVGRAAPASGTILGLGELLIQNALFFKGTAPVSGGSSQHSYPLPNDPALAGLVAYTQAFILGGASQATNGIKLILN